MTTTPTELALQPIGRAESQGTVIEQTRAVAVVVAQVQAARACPRIPEVAIAQMREACDQLAVAERAFYKFPRSGGTVTGPTVHLMDQLARCWQNIDQGMTELRRDMAGGYSEAKVYAWDMEANYRVEQSFIVPHKRDRKDGPQDLKELRDVYELVTNQSRRRVREAIRRVLPAWFVEEAIERCNETLRTGGKNAKPLPQRIADAVERFDALGVRAAQIEQKLGRPRAEWSPFDVAALAISYRAIQQGDVTVADEFPAVRVTAAEITAQSTAAPASAAIKEAAPKDAAGPPAEPEPSADGSGDGGLWDGDDGQVYDDDGRPA